MEKAKEIELLQSLKGDTYFAELFGDEQIDAMCENIRNDFPIEHGLKLFENSPVAKENAELKKKRLVIKLHSALPLSEDDRDVLAKLLTE